ncbi:hypothetical protein [Skermania sp. ID1734]|uniref:hypothetical protein n=1 Tax=Skermania sp. ID1734 TaxID=2597516 RepID=UPI0021082DFF|nr:hypothetical protein [Skermania sp. ID1734]
MHTAVLTAEIYAVVRIAAISFVITRLRGERPSGVTLVGAIGLAVLAVLVVAIKLVLTH